ncbi:MAG: hypothetical protein R6V49_10175 [Bacteroidales bacterium]
MKRIFVLILPILMAYMASAQVPRAFRSDSEGSVPRLEWYLPGVHDSIPFEVFRGFSGA